MKNNGKFLESFAAFAKAKALIRETPFRVVYRYADIPLEEEISFRDCFVKTGKDNVISIEEFFNFEKHLSETLRTRYWRFNERPRNRVLEIKKKKPRYISFGLFLFV